ncbi:MAG: serine/threonine protein kinase, partial [Trebonia sp.]
MGEFQLRARLGAGGMGRVYLGYSPAGRAVAVKVVHSELARDAEFRHRFGREVAAARAVGGMYTAPVVAAGLDDDPPWLATAYVPGPPLADVVA